MFFKLSLGGKLVRFSIAKFHETSFDSLRPRTALSQDISELLLASLPPDVGDVAHDDEDGSEHGEPQRDQSHLEPGHAPRLLHLLLHKKRARVQTDGLISELFIKYRERTSCRSQGSGWILSVD